MTIDTKNCVYALVQTPVWKKHWILRSEWVRLLQKIKLERNRFQSSGCDYSFDCLVFWLGVLLFSKLIEEKKTEPPKGRILSLDSYNSKGKLSLNCYLFYLHIKPLAESALLTQLLTPEETFVNKLDILNLVFSYVNNQSL